MSYVDPLHVPHGDLVVTYEGKEMYVLNKSLLDKQNCWKNLEKIKETHWLKLLIYDMMYKTNNGNLLRSFAKDLTEVEYRLQELWKFTPNANFHRFWEYPKCSCPILDNKDYYPYQQIYSNTCILHGKE